MNITGTKNLPALRTQAYLAIDMAAESCRELYISPGAGQALVYAHKLMEANAFVSAYPTDALAPTTPDTVNWPYMSAEVGITGTDMWSVAQAVIARADAWTAASRLIEAARLGAKRAVRDATTTTAIASAQSVTWPTPP